MRRFPRLVLPLLAALLATAAAAPTAPPSSAQRERALHALNRLGFGPRPGDVDRVLATGVDAWIDQQLHPERIADAALEQRLQSYETLRMSDAEIWDRFYAPVLAARKEKKAEAASSAAPDEETKRKLRASIPKDQRPQRLIEELSAQRVLRAVESNRQLDEVMVDFWFNHFNVFSGKGVDRVYLTGYERDTIRPRVWGRFEDLLRATAKSPAMLFYLDNARSVADPANRPEPAVTRLRRRGFYRPGTPMRRGGAPADAKRAKAQGGINENYAREIMELHTLGVDAGYTQKDVTELARVFTGWSISKPEEGGGFVFRPRLHDTKEKTVLGIHFRAGGGEEEGERMLHVLALHPATAHHLSLELCQRLVADEPPPALVDRVAKRYLATDGDLRETVKAVVTSPEFFDPRYSRTKVKSPFEYVVSATRAVDAKIDDPQSLVKALAQIGEPLYGSQPPTGYSDASSAWVNSGALLGRLNFALGLAGGKLAGVAVDVRPLLPAGSDDSVQEMARALTGGALSDATTRTIRARSDTKLETLAGLILGSPEFQKQ